MKAAADTTQIENDSDARPSSRPANTNECEQDNSERPTMPPPPGTPRLSGYPIGCCPHCGCKFRL